MAVLHVINKLKIGQGEITLFYDAEIKIRKQTHCDLKYAFLSHKKKNILEKIWVFIFASMIKLQPTIGILDTAYISQTLPPILVGSWEASCLLTTASPPWKVQIL